MRRSIDDLVADVRRGSERLTPAQAWHEATNGAVLVDTRSEDERRRQGWLVHGAAHHPLSTVLWRLDPDVPTSNRKLPLETRIVVICREGYSSSLAAAGLRAIGFRTATDVIGGVAGWLAAGLPLEPYDASEPRPPDPTSVDAAEQDAAVVAAEAHRVR